MSWVRISDDVVEDVRTTHAAAQLGPNGTGRVVAVLVEAFAYCNRQLTDGRLDPMIWPKFKTDRRPGDVLFAMAIPISRTEAGWMRDDGAGVYVIADYSKQPTRAQVQAKRKAWADLKAAQRAADRAGVDLRRQLVEAAAAEFRRLTPGEQRLAVNGERADLVDRVKRVVLRMTLPAPAGPDAIHRAVDDLFRGRRRA